MIRGLPRRQDVRRPAASMLGFERLPQIGAVASAREWTIGERISGDRTDERLVAERGRALRSGPAAGRRP